MSARCEATITVTTTHNVAEFFMEKCGTGEYIDLVCGHYKARVVVTGVNVTKEAGDRFRLEVNVEGYGQ